MVALPHNMQHIGNASSASGRIPLGPDGRDYLDHILYGALRGAVPKVELLKSY